MKARDLTAGHMTTVPSLFVTLLANSNSVRLVAYRKKIKARTTQSETTLLNTIPQHGIVHNVRQNTVVTPDWCSIADEIAQLKATFPNLLVPPSCSDSFLRCLTIKCRFIRITCWLLQVSNMHGLHHGYMFRYIMRKTPLFRLTCHFTLETTVWLLPTKREKYSRGKVEFFIATSCNTLQK